MQEEALLVIDVERRYNWTQEIIESDIIRKQRANAIKQILVLDRERAANGLRLFIICPNGYGGQEIQLERGQQSEIPNAPCIACGADLAEFLEHSHESFEPVFVKDDPDAFSNVYLALYLRGLGVKTVKLIGCNTWNCVLETAKGAVRNGFNVTLIEAGAYPPLDHRADYDEKRWIKGVSLSIPSNTNLLVKIE